MSVKQLPNGEWYYRFQVLKRPVRKQGFRTRAEALKAETLKKSELHLRLSTGQASDDGLRLKDACDVFFEEYALRYKRTWKGDRAHIRVIKEFFGDRRIREITPREVESFLRYVHKTVKGVKNPVISDHSVNRYLASLKSIINWAKKKRMYSGENPAWGVPMLKVPKDKVRWLGRDEERRLSPIIAKHPRLWPFYVIGLHSGMRIGEICAMQVKDFIPHPSPMVFIPNSKTYRSRYVPLSNQAAKVLAERAKGKAPDIRLLDAVEPRTVSEWFKDCCKMAQVPDFTFHCLRHTFAGYMLGKGVPIYKVSKMLGHTTVLTTEQHYGHLDRQVLKAEIHNIEDVITMPNLPSVGEPSQEASEVVNVVVNGDGNVFGEIPLSS